MVQDYSYTRLTLALDVIKKLTSGNYRGYHELGIIKHQIDLGDLITIEDSAEMELICTHPAVPEDEQNICWQAVELIKKEYGIEKNLKITIDKKIPVEGGLAGGSTNAATVLKLTNETWNLGLNRDKLVQLGRKLGMDVPFYFYGGTAFDSEATEVIIPIKTEMPLYFVLVIPPFGVSTAAAYQNINYNKVGMHQKETKELVKALENGSVNGLCKTVHNDFEYTVFEAYPQLQKIKDELLSLGALAVSLSGSGSTMIALVKNMEEAQEISSHFEETIIAKSL